MAIKAGQILHVGNDTLVIDRIQTAGPGNLNIPTEKIYELGNFESVATVRDVPDLSFTLESLDTSTEIEEWLTGGNPASGIAINAAKPVDVISPFKAGKDAAAPFNIVASVGLPYLTMESLSYRFGLRDNARQTVGLRGDSIFYNPGSTYIEKAVASGSAGQTVVTTNPALNYTDANGVRRALAVEVGTKRLSLGVDYTEDAVPGTPGPLTVTITDAQATGAEIRVMYASPTLRVYDQLVHAPTKVVVGAPSPKPAAVRGKDIDVYIGVGGASVPANKVGTVQAVTVDWRVTLEKDEEFGNYYAIGQDFDVPTVNGTIDLKPRDPADFFAKLRMITGTADPAAVIGPNTATPLPMDIVIKDGANAGAVLKRLHVDDARFTVPGFQGRTQQKLTVTLNWESDSGNLLVFNN